MASVGNKSRRDTAEIGENGSQIALQDGPAQDHAPEVPDGGFAAWMMVFGASLLAFNSWGLVTSFGIYQEYYSASMLEHETLSSISWIGTTQGCLLEFVGVFIGPMFDRGYFHSLIHTGGFLVVLGTMMLSLCSTYWQIFLAQGLCIGLGSGMIFVPGVSIVSKAFTKRRPVAVGLCVSASAIGGIIYPILFQQLQPRIGFPWAVRATGFLALITFLLSFAVLRDHKVTGTKPRALVDTKAFHEPPFMLYMIALTVRSAGYWVPFFYISTFATSHLHTSPQTGFYLLTITNAGGFVGRLLPGMLPKVLASVEVLPVATALAGLITLAWISIHNLAGFVVFCILYGILAGVSITMLTIMVPLLSPPDAVQDTIGTRLGMAYCACGIGILFGSPVAGALADLRTGDFTRAQAFAGAMQLGAVAMLGYPWYVVRRKAWSKS